MIVNALKYTVTVPDKRMREGNFEIYKEFVAFCRAVGCPGITIASGIVYKDDGQTEEEAHEISRDEMRRIPAAFTAPAFMPYLRAAWLA